ncbi:DMT family transporter [Psychrobacter sp. CCUG 69069]|uniref:DMT family transporter n=1 Tax=Psychrobacter namhaensis TaxID=292734 RepID=A0ABW8L8E8_9GAMM|nr:DMT family transporter [Psychrobacter sp. CCUG 69069]MCD1279662.1 DMT family transporter [Psychrobacter sp. CCUG 69069]
MKATFYTVIALLAFAANSLFCRMALAEGYIDAWGFTIIRLMSAAVCLGVIMTLHAYRLRSQAVKYSHTDREALLNDKGSWLSSFSLVVYALCFSLAYVALDTGTGALILFSAVQLTMIGWGIYKKEQLSTLQWLAFFVAVAGFIYLMLPSVAAPSLLAATLMAVSGVAWGVYSIRGKSCISPLRATGFNFFRSLVAVPILLIVGIYLNNTGVTNSHLESITTKGIVLACASGAIASGMGYSIWYTAMPLLKNTQAAIVQLCVPVLAALLGVVFLSEPLTVPFVVASAIILGAVLVFILNKDTPKAFDPRY